MSGRAHSPSARRPSTNHTRAASPPARSKRSGSSTETAAPHVPSVSLAAAGAAVAMSPAAGSDAPSSRPKSCALPLPPASQAAVPEMNVPMDALDTAILTASIRARSASNAVPATAVPATASSSTSSAAAAPATTTTTTTGPSLLPVPASSAPRPPTRGKALRLAPDPVSHGSSVLVTPIAPHQQHSETAGVDADNGGSTAVNALSAGLHVSRTSAAAGRAGRNVKLDGVALPPSLTITPAAAAAGQAGPTSSTASPSALTSLASNPLQMAVPRPATKPKPLLLAVNTAARGHHGIGALSADNTPRSAGVDSDAAADEDDGDDEAMSGRHSAAAAVTPVGALHDSLTITNTGSTPHVVLRALSAQTPATATAVSAAAVPGSTVHMEQEQAHPADQYEFLELANGRDVFETALSQQPHHHQQSLHHQRVLHAAAAAGAMSPEAKAGSPKRGLAAAAAATAAAGGPASAVVVPGTSSITGPKMSVGLRHDHNVAGAATGAGATAAQPKGGHRSSVVDSAEAAPLRTKTGLASLVSAVRALQLAEKEDKEVAHTKQQQQGSTAEQARQMPPHPHQLQHQHQHQQAQHPQSSPNGSSSQEDNGRSQHDGDHHTAADGDRSQESAEQKQDSDDEALDPQLVERTKKFRSLFRAVEQWHHHAYTPEASGAEGKDGSAAAAATRLRDDDDDQSTPTTTGSAAGSAALPPRHLQLPLTGRMANPNRATTLSASAVPDMESRHATMISQSSELSSDMTASFNSPLPTPAPRTRVLRHSRVVSQPNPDMSRDDDGKSSRRSTSRRSRNNLRGRLKAGKRQLRYGNANDGDSGSNQPAPSRYNRHKRSSVVHMASERKRRHSDPGGGVLAELMWERITREAHERVKRIQRAQRRAVRAVTRAARESASATAVEQDIQIPLPSIESSADAAAAAGEPKKRKSSMSIDSDSSPEPSPRPSEPAGDSDSKHVTGKPSGDLAGALFSALLGRRSTATAAKAQPTPAAAVPAPAVAAVSATVDADGADDDDRDPDAAGVEPALDMGSGELWKESAVIAEEEENEPDEDEQGGAHRLAELEDDGRPLRDFDEITIIMLRQIFETWFEWCHERAIRRRQMRIFRQQVKELQGSRVHDKMKEWYKRACFYGLERGKGLSYNSEVRKMLESQNETVAVELPRSIQLMCMREAYPIVRNMVVSYIDQLGNKNPITARAVRYAQELAASAGVPCEFTGAWRDMTKSAIRAMSKRNLKSSRV